MWQLPTDWSEGLKSSDRSQTDLGDSGFVHREVRKLWMCPCRPSVCPSVIHPAEGSSLIASFCLNIYAWRESSVAAQLWSLSLFEVFVPPLGGICESAHEWGLKAHSVKTHQRVVLRERDFFIESFTNWHQPQRSAQREDWLLNEGLSEEKLWQELFFSLDWREPDQTGSDCSIAEKSEHHVASERKLMSVRAPNRPDCEVILRKHAELTSRALIHSQIFDWSSAYLLLTWAFTLHTCNLEKSLFQSLLQSFRNVWSKGQHSPPISSSMCLSSSHELDKPLFLFPSGLCQSFTEQIFNFWWQKEVGLHLPFLWA